MHSAPTDSLICTWQQKRDVGFWRPFQAISGLYDDGNPRTTRSPAGLPSSRTRNYSDYLSGHGVGTSPQVEVVRRRVRRGDALELRSSAGAPRPYTTCRRSSSRRSTPGSGEACTTARRWPTPTHGAPHGDPLMAALDDGGVGTAVGRVDGDGVAARDQQLQVGPGLEHRQRLVESVEIVERVLVPGPGQPRGDVVRASAPGASASALGQPLLVVGEQLVDPRVHRRRDRAVRGQQRRPASLVPWSARRGSRRAAARPHRLEADRRRDVRQHVVAGEQQPGRPVGEHDVPLGVPGRRARRAARAASDPRSTSSVEPLVRLAPVPTGPRRGRRPRPQPAPARRRPRRAAARRSACRRLPARARARARLLADPERDPAAELRRTSTACV